MFLDTTWSGKQNVILTALDIFGVVVAQWFAHWIASQKVQV